MLNWILDILRGAVMGIANIIPGVSGGTMAVSMGIYDRMIYAVNNIVKKFKESLKTLLPIVIGMLIGLFAFAALIGHLLGTDASTIPLTRLPTNFAFIGLILGGLPAIYKRVNIRKAGLPGLLLFILFFAIVVVLPLLTKPEARTVDHSFPVMLLMVGLGAIASAAMVIPGISGSMMLKIFGYYEPIVTQTLGGTFKDAIPAGNWSLVLHNIGVLLPFAVGIVIGIFGVAKLIEVLLKKWKVYTYCGILGMVVASPAVIRMDAGIYEGFNAWIGIAAAAALVLGVFCAVKLGGDPEPAKE